LNHASIIDGVRLCKAERYRYAHSNMEELENIHEALAEADADKLEKEAKDKAKKMKGQ